MDDAGRTIILENCCSAGDSDEPFLLVKFGPKGELTDERVEEIKALREAGDTVPAIIMRTGFSKASVYRALG